jgi:hypothetical protein
MTACVQPIYPASALVSKLAFKQTMWSRLQCDAFSGIALAPFLAVWNNKRLHTQEKFGVKHLRTSHLWAVRNFFVVPCIIGGQNHVRSFLSKDFQQHHAEVTQLMCSFIPSFVASVVSHPIDNWTNMRGYGTCENLHRGIIRFSPGFLPRFIAFTLECNIFAKVLDYLSE